VREPLLITSMLGLGDSIYCRAVLRELAKTREVYAYTPWPTLLADTQIKCVKPTTRLRTQNKNMDRPYNWASVPGIVDARTLTYTGRPGTMLQALCESVGVKAETLDFSGPPVANLDREPYILVRPVTRRTEWKSDSREPRAEYLCEAVEAMRPHYRIISVADIAPPHEVAVPPLPWADETYHNGEKTVEELLALVAGAAGVVAGVGWAVPACIAYRTPLFLVYGGCLGHNGPARIMDPRLDTSRIYGVMPDSPCHCRDSSHACTKSIADLDRHIEAFAAGLVAPVATA
jgi:hypothetical protein